MRLPAGHGVITSIAAQFCWFRSAGVIHVWGLAFITEAFSEVLKLNLERLYIWTGIIMCLTMMPKCPWGNGSRFVVTLSWPTRIKQRGDTDGGLGYGSITNGGAFESLRDKVEINDIPTERKEVSLYVTQFKLFHKTITVQPWWLWKR